MLSGVQKSFSDTSKAEALPNNYCRTGMNTEPALSTPPTVAMTEASPFGTPGGKVTFSWSNPASVNPAHSMCTLV
jgi:hypothetical protein